MFQTKVVEKVKTHVLCSIIPPPLISCLYEIMRKNMAEQDRPLMII
jgi:hypothetical protein